MTESTWTKAWLLFALSGGACAPALPAAEVTLHLDHANLREVARVLTEATGRRTAVFGASVDPVAECITISIVDPRRVSAGEAVRLIQRALADVGVRVELDANSVRFLAAPGATLPACPSTAAEAAEPEPPLVAAPEAISPEEISPEEISPEEAFRRDVRRVSDTEVVVTRAALEALFENQAGLLMRTARIIPREENGVASLGVYAIRRLSPLGVLGLQNGDRIRSINGYAMSSPDAALEAYARLRSADELAVELTRRGAPVTLRIRIVTALPE
ncbi:MAG: hypothetical protein M5U28_11550 [Sandaracinaceae bacterium]|nr:hypothetical protein [Sandaracinaceae bacterium]